MTEWALDKVQARKYFADIRKKAQAHTPQAGQALAVFADTLMERFSPSTAGLFWPYRTEIDTRALLYTLQQKGVVIGLPVTGEAGTPLMFRKFSDEDDFIKGEYNIPIPSENSPEVMPDLVFVPFLGIDNSGFRLGYGGGYYDRTIAHYNALGLFPKLIGLGFDEQRVEKLPIGEFDMPLDGVLTPSGLYLF